MKANIEYFACIFRANKEVEKRKKKSSQEFFLPSSIFIVFFIFVKERKNKCEAVAFQRIRHSEKKCMFNVDVHCLSVFMS